MFKKDGPAPSWDFGAIEKEAMNVNPKHRLSVGLGDWGLKLFSTKKGYIKDFNVFLMQKIMVSSPKNDSKKSIEIYMIDAKDNSEAFRYKNLVPGHRFGSNMSRHADTWVLVTLWFRVFMYRDKNTVKIAAFIKESKLDRVKFKEYLQVLIHKVFFLFDILIVHSASVRFHGKTYTFIGERGAGKSTICLKLAKQGAAIISEDHTLIRRRGNKFFAAGFEDLSRVAQKSEKHIFKRPINYKTRRIGGFFKKEFPLKNFFNCEFYREFPVGLLFFIHCGNNLHLRPISRQEAVVKLMRMTNPLFRINRPEDYDAYINYFYTLVRNVKVFDLQRTQNIEELDLMEDLIRKC